MRTHALYLALASLLAACSTGGQEPTAWLDTSGAGRGNPELQAADAACEQIRKETSALGAGVSRNPHTAYFDCMRARGWQLVREPSGADYCVTLTTKAGDTFTTEAGRVVRVERLVGLSKRCSGQYPVLATAHAQ